jgi:hypothetical protein
LYNAWGVEISSWGIPGAQKFAADLPCEWRDWFNPDKVMPM